MEAEEKIKEIEVLVTELRKLERYFYTPMQKLRLLRVEIDSSIDLLRVLQERIKRADKKGLDLTAEVAMAAAAEASDLNMMDKFFEQATNLLAETKKEVEERWQTIKELRQTTSAQAPEQA